MLALHRELVGKVSSGCAGWSETGPWGREAERWTAKQSPEVETAVAFLRSRGDKSGSERWGRTGARVSWFWKSCVQGRLQTLPVSFPCGFSKKRPHTRYLNTGKFIPAVQEARCPKSRCLSRVGSFWRLWRSVCSLLLLPSGGGWSSLMPLTLQMQDSNLCLHLHLCPDFLLTRTPVIRLRPPPIPVWPQLNSITSAKTLFPNKVPSTWG